MIDIEQVAQRLDRREDAKVVAYREIGLPVFRVNSLLTLQEAGSLGAIEEFVLRCLSQAVDSTNDIERFLGLPAKLVASQLGQLSFEGAISQVESSPPRYALTKKGRTRLEEAASARLTKEQMPIYVDGITRGVIAADPQELWTNAQLEQLGISVVPPTPRRPPRASEVDLAGVNRMFALIGGVERPTKRAVRLDAIVGRISVVFRRAIALAFKSDDGKRMSIGFAIDGRSADEHEIAFARSADAQRSVLFRTMFDADRRRREIQHVVRELRSDLPEIAAHLPRGGNARPILSIRRPSPAISATPIGNLRVLSVYEHAPLLARAFDTATKRILILSPLIRANVVDQEFVKGLAKCLGRGVEITIGYGTDRHDAGEQQADRTARETLVALGKTFSNLQFVRKGSIHAKVLLVDSSFFVVTTFNWLSFKGDPNQPMREEEGILVDDPPTVEAYFRTLTDRIRGGDARSGGETPPLSR